MSIKKVVILLVAVLLWGGSEALAIRRDNRTSISVISGERWWGLVVDEGRCTLPFERSFVLNSGAPAPTTFRANVLISNRGRFVRSQEPMVVSYDGDKIVVTPTEGEKPLLEKGGRTLRESYLVHHHKYVADSLARRLPVTLFERPIYELGGRDALLYTQQDVLEFARMLKQRGAPEGVILLPLGWHTPSGVMTFDEVAYPDPKAMIEELRKEGMGVMLTVSPYVMAAGRNYQRCRKAGMLLADTKGEPIVFQSRYGYTACRALTPEGVAELNASLRDLQTELGVAGFYFDMLDAVNLLGGDSKEVENYLAAWRRVGQGLDVAIYSSPLGGPDNEIVTSVSTTRQYSWQELERSVRRIINASLLGYDYTTLAADLDFGGDQQLILRTAQFAALMPVAIIPYSAWSLEDSSALCEALRWRCENGDYVAALASHCIATAEPMVRHLEYQFPRMGFTNCDNEYMFGTEWLVVPVVSSGTTQMVRLPKGSWKLYGTDRVFRGPRVIDLDISDGKMALFQLVK